MSAEFPVTNIGLANALLAAHNAAMTAGHERSYGSGPATPIDIACIISASFAAVAEQLATSQEAYPETVCPVPKTADMAVAMHLVGTEAMQRLAPERMRTDMITIPRELFSDMTESLATLRLGIINEAYKQQVDKYVFRAEELLQGVSQSPR